jgi:phosphatidylglycerophosphate synthase
MRKRHPLSYYVINSLTLYRLIAAPVLTALAFTGNETLFGWLLAVSFFTDLIDGTLARWYKVASVAGSRLDSIADDLTILAGVIGLFVLKKDFVREQHVIIIILAVLLVAQNLYALIRYGKISSFHTYSAKLAAIVQGSFLILMFLLPEPVYPLFYAAAIVSAIDLVEEMILVYLLKDWKTDVKGLYWVLKEKRKL